MPLLKQHLNKKKFPPKTNIKVVRFDLILRENVFTNNPWTSIFSYFPTVTPPSLNFPCLFARLFPLIFKSVVFSFLLKFISPERGPKAYCLCNIELRPCENLGSRIGKNNMNIFTSQPLSWWLLILEQFRYTLCSLTVLQWCQNEIEYSMRNKRKLKLLKEEKEEKKRSKWDSPKISSWMQIADIWRTSYHLRPWPFWWSSVPVESLTKIERMFLETLVFQLFGLTTKWCV